MDRPGQCDPDGAEDATCHLKPADLARRWRVNPRTLERWRATGEGPPWLCLRGSIRYRLGDVLDYERDHLVVPASDAPGCGETP